MSLLEFVMIYTDEKLKKRVYDSCNKQPKELELLASSEVSRLQDMSGTVDVKTA